MKKNLFLSIFLAIIAQRGLSQVAGCNIGPGADPKIDILAPGGSGFPGSLVSIQVTVSNNGDLNEIFAQTLRVQVSLGCNAIFSTATYPVGGSISSDNGNYQILANDGTTIILRNLSVLDVLQVDQIFMNAIRTVPTGSCRYNVPSDVNSNIVYRNATFTGCGTATPPQVSIQGNQDSNNDNSTTSITVIQALPIKLLNFSGSKIEKSSFLSWKFQDAINFSHFEIERSPDGKNFIKINEQAHTATQGALRQSVIVSYQILDENPLRRYNYYRLKIVDLDGTFTYSNMVKINFEDGPINVFPNPFTNNLQIEGLSTDTEARIEIYDESGKIFYKYKSLSGGISSLDNINTLNPGLYMIKIIQEDKLVMVKKVVKL